MKLSELRRFIREKSVQRGDCRIWQGAFDPDGVPRMRDADGKTKNVRRVLLIALGVDVSGKLATTSCDNTMCVCEKHAVAWTRKELQARSSKKQAGNVALSMKRAVNGRKTSPLTMEQVREMRASGMTVREAAAAHGVCLRTAQKALRGESWKEYGSPFAGLGASL